MNNIWVLVRFGLKETAEIIHGGRLTIGVLNDSNTEHIVNKYFNLANFI